MTAAVTVVGLGPGSPDLRTLRAQARLDAARRIILRTGVHPGLDDLLGDPRVTACDDLYDRLDTFDAVYDAVAARVLDAADTGPVVLAVPGHPRFGEASVTRLIGSCAKRGLSLEVVDGISALDVVATALDIDPLSAQLQIVDAAALEATLDREPYAGGLLALDPTRPCLVTQVYGPAIASSVKIALGRRYPDDHPIVLVGSAGVDGEGTTVACPLHRIDRQSVDHLSSVWVAAMDPLTSTRAPETLQRIVATLRAPGGCPWDRAQTHGSLRGAVLEEAYETVDAIDTGDAENLAEELGDLVLQAFMHAQIAEEAGSFAIEDVFAHVSEKLVRRHPHVFATATAETPDDVVATWNRVKAEERRAKSPAGSSPSPPGDGLPRSMPALLRAAMVLRDHTAPSSVPHEPEDVLGDRLLAAVTALAAAGHDPERALNDALTRSRNRTT